MIILVLHHSKPCIIESRCKILSLCHDFCDTNYEILGSRVKQAANEDYYDTSINYTLSSKIMTK